MDFARATASRGQGQERQPAKVHAAAKVFQVTHVEPAARVERERSYFFRIRQVQWRSEVCWTELGSTLKAATKSRTSATLRAARSESANIFCWCSLASPAYVLTSKSKSSSVPGRTRSRTKMRPPRWVT